MAAGLMTVVSSFWVDKRRSKKMPLILLCQCMLLVGFSVLFALASHIKDHIAVCYTFVIIACMGIYPIVSTTPRLPSPILTHHRFRHLQHGASIISLGRRSAWPVSGFSPRLQTSAVSSAAGSSSTPKARHILLASARASHSRPQASSARLRWSGRISGTTRNGRTIHVKRLSRCTLRSSWRIWVIAVPCLSMFFRRYKNPQAHASHVINLRGVGRRW